MQTMVFFGLIAGVSGSAVDAGNPLQFVAFLLRAPLAPLDRALWQQSCFRMPVKAGRSRLWSQRSPMSGVGQVFGLRKSGAGACHAGSKSFSGYAADFLPGRPIATVLSTA